MVCQRSDAPPLDHSSINRLGAVKALRRYECRQVSAADRATRNGTTKTLRQKEIKQRWRPFQLVHTGKANKTAKTQSTRRTAAILTFAVLRTPESLLFAFFAYFAVQICLTRGERRGRGVLVLEGSTSLLDLRSPKPASAIGHGHGFYENPVTERIGRARRPQPIEPPDGARAVASGTKLFENMAGRTSICRS